MSKSILIEAKDLEKKYSDGTRALRGVSLNVNKGEFLAVMGPSGSGKSTLLHILGFLDNPTSGTYRFLDKSFTSYNEEEVALIRNEEIGFVFQMFNLLPKTSVYENVLLPTLYSKLSHSEAKERALKAIEAVDLNHRINNLSNELSGGEKQRVAIARALINDPQIIFADEPTGNLDSKTGIQIMEILRKLNKEDGKTIILITHEKTTASYADRVIQMLDGKVDRDVHSSHAGEVNKYLK